jgi:rfaE bifunctional protein kinase chain/domain
VSEKECKIFRGLAPERLNDILTGIRKVKIALIGDICLDVYWKADMTKSELSRETPHFPLPVVEEWMSPGGGGNAAANIAALNPSRVNLLGVVGMDWRGDALLKEITKRNIETDGIIKSDKRVTNAYCKPLRRGISNVEYEDPRIDFDNFEPLAKEEEAKLIMSLENIAPNIDVLCVSDQMKYGCITPFIRKKIIDLAGQGLKVIVDSRDRIGLYTGVILKPNEVEGYRAVNNTGDPRMATFEELAAAARILAVQNKSSVCMTLGPKGCVLIEGGMAVYVPSNEVSPPIDTCGAGDAFLAAFSCASAAGAEACEAAVIANMAADVTIKKIGTTGTVSTEEIKIRHCEILRMEANV